MRLIILFAATAVISGCSNNTVDVGRNNPPLSNQNTVPVNTTPSPSPSPTVRQPQVVEAGENGRCTVGWRDSRVDKTLYDGAQFICKVNNHYNLIFTTKLQKSDTITGKSVKSIDGELQEVKTRLLFPIWRDYLEADDSAAIFEYEIDDNFFDVMVGGSRWVYDIGKKKILTQYSFIADSQEVVYTVGASKHKIFLDGKFDTEQKTFQPTKLMHDNQVVHEFQNVAAAKCYGSCLDNLFLQPHFGELFDTLAVSAEVGLEENYGTYYVKMKDVMVPSVKVTPMQWIKYTNNEHHFSLQYPSTWVIDDSDHTFPEQPSVIIRKGNLQYFQLWPRGVPGLGLPALFKQETIIVNGKRVAVGDFGRFIFAEFSPSDTSEVSGMQVVMIFGSEQTKDTMLRILKSISIDSSQGANN